MQPARLGAHITPTSQTPSPAAAPPDVVHRDNLGLLSGSVPPVREEVRIDTTAAPMKEKERER